MNRKLFLFLILFSSCDKLIDIPSNNSFIQKKEILDNSQLLESYIYSVYDDLYYIFNNQNSGVPYNNISVILGAFSDEFVANLSLSNSTMRHAFTNSYHLNETTIPDFFVPMYKLIVRCNNMIEFFLYNTSSENNQFKNEMRVVRTIIYFYLIQLYEEIPLLTSADADVNLLENRRKNSEIYDFCLKELEDVYKSISDNKMYLSAINNTNIHYTERINKRIVAYYLSCFYLLNKDFNNSIKYSLLAKNGFNFENTYANKFEISSSENIWLLTPSINNRSLVYNNSSASFLNYKLLPATNPFSASSRPFSISDSLINSMSFVDKRRISFVDSVFFNSKWRYLPKKYKVIGRYNINDVREQFVIIRLPMIYFNLMEAYYMNGQKDLSIKIYNEMNENNYTSYEPVDAISLNDIISERNKEMFSEQGDRWFALKRTNLIDSVMGAYLPLKNSNEEKWNHNMKYLPIPIRAILDNPNL